MTKLNEKEEEIISFLPDEMKDAVRAAMIRAKEMNATSLYRIPVKIAEVYKGHGVKMADVLREYAEQQGWL